MKIFVTGGAGFIGNSVISKLLENEIVKVINIDNLSYAGNLKSLKKFESNKNYIFEEKDICDYNSISNLFQKYSPDAIIHLAAESHVDKSIEAPDNFIKTNIFGTYNLLQNSLYYWKKLGMDKKKLFRFHHVSTDEVFGELSFNDPSFNEKTPYRPNSPYSASKASSDHLVRAWGKTYNFPYIITNCSNNYGPYQFPEKLIPHIVINAIKGNKLPIYGDGLQIRDWLFVEDHASALIKVLFSGTVFNTYNIGGNNEKKNIEVVNLICEILDELMPKKPKGIKKYADLIIFVDDRPGHDFRYSIDTSKILKELNWSPNESFETGLRKTILWYLENRQWWDEILDRSYDLGRQGFIKK
tara:strand:- start:7919 stop:8986 length:1068 start_codon:yes stop_codon:yes gene_type:complete